MTKPIQSCWIQKGYRKVLHLGRFECIVEKCFDGGCLWRVTFNIFGCSKKVVSYLGSGESSSERAAKAECIKRVMYIYYSLHNDLGMGEAEIKEWKEMFPNTKIPWMVYFTEQLPRR